VTRNSHVEAEVMAAWSEGRLPASEATAVESHLAGCGRCQEVLAVFARSEPGPAEAGHYVNPADAGRHVESGFSRIDRWFGVRWRWAIPVAAAATAAAIWVAVPEQEPADSFERTVESTIESPAVPNTPAAADTAAPPSANQSATARRDAPLDRLEPAQRKEAPAAKTERFEAADTREVREREQDLRAEAAPPPAAPAAARQAAAATLAAPPPTAEAVSPDPNVRWRIQPPGRLERSTNAGKTWEAVPLPDAFNVTSVTAPAPQAAILTGADGRQFRTDDQGKTWNLLQP
jgi:hypothetical protein